MTQNFKLAFKNTLWFLLPSGITFLAIIALNVYLGFNGFAAPRAVNNGSLILVPNIPFFIASLVLFAFLRKGFSRIVSILVSNGVAIVGSLLFIPSFPFIFLSEDIYFNIDFDVMFFVLVNTILALIIFFVRSITARYEFAANAGYAEVTKPQSGANKFYEYGLVMFISIVFIYLLLAFSFD